MSGSSLEPTSERCIACRCYREQIVANQRFESRTEAAPAAPVTVWNCLHKPVAVIPSPVPSDRLASAETEAAEKSI